MGISKPAIFMTVDWHYILCTDLEPLQAAEEHEEEKKEPLTPITDLSFPPTLHIPEYFGLVSSCTSIHCRAIICSVVSLLTIPMYMHIHDSCDF